MEMQRIQQKNRVQIMACMFENENMKKLLQNNEDFNKWQEDSMLYKWTNQERSLPLTAKNKTIRIKRRR
jgi:hypothetical protein